MIRRLLLSLAALALPLTAAAQPQPGPAPRVAIETELGTIEVVLEAGRAPLTAENFLRHVDAGTYTGGHFHRTVTLTNQPANPVKIEVIQGGPRREEANLPPVRLERTRDTGLRHVDGVLSMARATPDSATSNFFICVGDQPALDFGGKRNADGQGFAAFGRVVQGMDIVRRIQARPQRDQALTPPVRILRMRRLPAA